MEEAPNRQGDTPAIAAFIIAIVGGVFFLIGIAPLCAGIVSWVVRPFDVDLSYDIFDALSSQASRASFFGWMNYFCAWPIFIAGMTLGAIGRRSMRRQRLATIGLWLNVFYIAFPFVLFAIIAIVAGGTLD